MSLPLNKVHVESLIDIMVQELILEGLHSNVLHFFLADLVLIISIEGLFRVSFNAADQISYSFKVVRILLEQWVEVPLKSNRGAFISWCSHGHVEWKPTKSSQPFLSEVTILECLLDKLFRSHLLWSKSSFSKGFCQCF